MNKNKQDALNALVDEETAKEQVMLERLLSTALSFYKKPDNLQAFKAWQQNKEEQVYAANYSNA